MATDEHDLVAEFASGLRGLMTGAGIPSYREVARRAHFSHTAIAAAASGKALPSLEVTLGFVAACGGDAALRADWEARWHAVRAVLDALAFDPADAAPPWPPQEVADGADPEQAGCTADAATVHARKVALDGTRTIVGQVELRYSRRRRAAWGRFAGFPGLDHLAGEREVVVAVGVRRAPDDIQPDGAQDEYVAAYAFDHHFSSLLVTRRTPVHAYLRLVVDGEQVAYGETDRLELP